MAESSRLQELFDKYLRRECTPAEVQELAGLLNQEDADNLLSPEMLRLWKELKEDPAVYPVDWAAMYSRVTGQRRKVKRKPGRITALVAAAAVAALFLLGAWYLRQRDAGFGAGQEALAKSAGVAPGSNKAVLTLANGTSITLNQHGNGLVASQGNTSVILLDSGRLTYRQVPLPQRHNAEQPSTVSFNTLTTPRGGQFRLRLPDGTLVWLNAASSIRYPTAFTGDERKVQVSGEAYFEVAPDPSRPFTASISSSPGSQEEETIRVLGTHFNINDYPDESTIKTTLVQGSILVEPAQGGSRTILAPGQQAELKRNGEMKVLQHADVDETVAWKDGLFVFHKDELPAIMRRLTRWYDVDVTYAGDTVPTAHFTGAVRRKENLSEVLKMLQWTGGACFTIEGRQVIVSR